MSKMSFLDKIGILFEMTKSSIWFLLVLVALSVIGILIIKSNKKNSRKNKIAYSVFGIVVVTIILFIYHKSISKIFDYMMNNLFIAIYFPNLAIYFAAIIITNIIVWISIFNYKTSEIIKRLNIVIYVIMNYLLFLILHVVTTQKLDVFNQSSIYNNKNATALIELSSIIFMAWVIFLVAYKIILIYIKKEYKPKVKKVIVKKKVKVLPENYEPIEMPMLIQGNITHKVKIPKDYEYVSAPMFVSGKVSHKEEIKLYEDMLTLDDYKRILEILKNKKSKQRKQKEIVNEHTKEQQQIRELKQQEKEVEEAHLTELENLFRSIR